MALFTPFLIEMVPLAGMPAGSGWWPDYWSWSVAEFGLLVAIVTLLSVYESGIRLFRGDSRPFMWPWMLVLKMFAIAFSFKFWFWRLVCRAAGVDPANS